MFGQDDYQYIYSDIPAYQEPSYDSFLNWGQPVEYDWENAPTQPWILDWVSQWKGTGIDSTLFGEDIGVGPSPTKGDSLATGFKDYLPLIQSVVGSFGKLFGGDSKAIPKPIARPTTTQNPLTAGLGGSLPILAIIGIGAYLAFGRKGKGVEGTERKSQ